MKDLSPFLRDYVTPTLKPFGYRKKANQYQVDAGENVAFLSFSPIRIDPRAVVFHVTCSIVPEPYWQWLNRQYIAAGVPDPSPAGALATFSVLPPDSAAHMPGAPGQSGTRWAFSGQNRAEVGDILAEVLTSEAVPKLQRLLDREELLAALKSPESPSIRRWGVVQSELVLMADVNPPERVEQLLSLLDQGNAFTQHFDQWIALRRAYAC